MRLLTHLLIVPYGIETKSQEVGITDADILLIVPYGIETTSQKIHSGPVEHLLIVPYGIETLNFPETIQLGSVTFNRTLWN